MCLHPDDVLDTLNTMEAREFQVVPIQNRTNVQLFFKV